MPNIKRGMMGAAGGAGGVPAGQLWAWGSNGDGRLGNGTSYAVTPAVSSPIQIGALTDWAWADGAIKSSAAIKTDATLWTWGSPTNGQLGNGGSITVDMSSPIQIGALTDWSKVKGNDGTHSPFKIATKTDGTLWAWGDNRYGQLGDGTVVDRSSPVQIGALTTWTGTFGLGLTAALIIKADGTLWTWGKNDSGQLGLGNTIYRSSPVQIGALTSWAQCSASYVWAAAIRTDGTLWTWGSDTAGELGQNTVYVSRSSPTQVGALTDWNGHLSAGRAGGHVVKQDGTLWGWGRGLRGRLGDGTTVNKSSPVQIGSLTDWSTVESKDFRSTAIKTDGTIWAWGKNNNGQLGDGTAINRSSPVQIGSAYAFTQVSTGSYHTLGIT